MTKIMLVNDNDDERDFLEQVLTRLNFEVIAVKKGSILSEQLIDHFPDVVFASTLGKNEKILMALAKIKEARGKPKVVFIRQEKEKKPLSPDKRKVIDGVVYSPIDPFKLIEVLSTVTSVEIAELRKLYNDMLKSKKETHNIDPMDAPADSIILGGTSSQKKSDNSKIITTGGVSLNKSAGGVLVIDYERKKKYQEICNQLNKEKKEPPQFDSNRLRELQKMQSNSVKEEPEVKENRKHFLKTLFTMEPQKKPEEE